MYAAGAEHFAPPEEFDRETLRRLAVLCTKLRSVPNAKRGTIQELSRLAVDVQQVDLASAAIKRHLKALGTQPNPAPSKLLALWYVVDSLIKEHRTTFRVAFQDDLADLVVEGMPWECPEIGAKLQGLVNTWTSVFPAPIMSQIEASRKKRVWNREHPMEFKALRAEEEATWAREEGAHEDEDGLDEYAQPCMRYLQGKCEAGEDCPLFHPEGKEGTLPPEARPGDWRCDQCGSINRHWRRRCFHCPAEKPQYKKASADQIPLVAADDSRFDVFKAQFGYDAFDEDAAVEFWDKYFTNSATTTSDWISDRSAAYRVRILRRAPRSDEEAELRTTLHYVDAETIATKFHAATFDDDGHVAKKRGLVTGASAAQHGQSSSTTMVLPSVPTMQTTDQLTWIHNKLVEAGPGDASFAGYLYRFVEAIKSGVSTQGAKFRDVEWLGYIVLDVCRTAFHAFALERTKVGAASFQKGAHPAYPFFDDLGKVVASVPVPGPNRTEVDAMVRFVVGCTASTQAPSVPLPNVLQGSADQADGGVHDVPLPAPKIGRGKA
eukprot:PhM_4_TR11979/c0_g1_i1/m.83930